MKIGRCEDEKMIYRPPLLEEPFAQTPSGNHRSLGFSRVLNGFQGSPVLAPGCGVGALGSAGAADGEAAGTGHGALDPDFRWNGNP